MEKVVSIDVSIVGEVGVVVCNCVVGLDGIGVDCIVVVWGDDVGLGVGVFDVVVVVVVVVMIVVVVVVVVVVDVVEGGPKQPGLNRSRSAHCAQRPQKLFVCFIHTHTTKNITFQQ
jgi:hypothetical protein